jgi:alpha-glucosidase
VGENDDIAYHGQDDELHMVFNFPLMKTERLTPDWIRHNQASRLGQLARISPKAWPCNTLGNHDSPRVYNRFGDGRNDAQLARLSLALMLTLRGTPFLYYGEEIGMTDLMLKDISQFRDMLGTWLYEAELRELGVSHEQAFKHAVELTRDKCRTPMQWSNVPNAGFCPPGVEPWLPVHPNYAEGINVQDQLEDDGSLLSFYRRMLSLRKDIPALIAGDYQSMVSGADVDKQVLAFLRRTPQQTVLVAMNYSEQPQELDLAASGTPDLAGSRVLFSNRSPHAEVMGMRLGLSPFEIFIAEIRA